MLKNNSGLVEFAKQALKVNAGYVWGTWGQIMTEQIIESRRLQYIKSPAKNPFKDGNNGNTYGSRCKKWHIKEIFQNS